MLSLSKCSKNNHINTLRIWLIMVSESPDKLRNASISYADTLLLISGHYSVVWQLFSHNKYYGNGIYLFIYFCKKWIKKNKTLKHLKWIPRETSNPLFLNWGQPLPQKIFMLLKRCCDGCFGWVMLISVLTHLGPLGPEDPGCLERTMYSFDTICAPGQCQRGWCMFAFCLQCVGGAWKFPSLSIEPSDQAVYDYIYIDHVKYYILIFC